MRALSRISRDLLAFEPGVRDAEAGLRCALGVLLPLSLLMLLGRLDLMVFAVFGAFTGVYGRNMDFGPRVRTQLRAAALMCAVILLAMLGHAALGPSLRSSWALVGVTTLVAGLAAAVAEVWVFRPSGPLFHIFAFAAIASMPSHPPLRLGMLVAVLTCALGLIIGAAANYRPGLRPEWQLTEGPALRERMRLAAAEGALSAAAAGSAGAIALLAGSQTGLGHQYWAMVAAVVPLQALRARHAVFRGLQRTLGALLGLIPLGLVLWLSPGPWGTLAAVGVCQFFVELLVVRQYMLAQVFITPLALLSIGLTGGVDPRLMLADRVLETAIGSAVGLTVLLAVRYPDRIVDRWRPRHPGL